MAVDRSNQLVEAGLCLQLSGDLEGARRLWTQALSQNPANERARRCLEALHGGSTPGEPLPGNEDQGFSALGSLLDGDAPAAGPDSMMLAAAHLMTPGPFALLGPDDPTPTPRRNPFARPEAGTLPSALETSPFASGLFGGADLSPSGPDEFAPPLFSGVAAPDVSAPNAGAPVSFADQLAAMAEEAEALRATYAPFPPAREEGGPGASPAKNAAQPGATRAEQVAELLLGVHELMELDDHTGAHDSIVKVLDLDPENAEAKALLFRSDATLLAMYESRIGALSRRPQVVLRADEIVWLNIDHRAGFLLSLIDGESSYDDLFVLSSMSRLDTARILNQLLVERVIE